MVKLPIDIHPEAILEEDAAFEYYRERSLNAAEGFYEELLQARHAILDSPNAWGVYLHGTRRYLLQRYPYLVDYRVAEQRIQVIAVAHGRRKPGYWVGRLRSD